MTYFCSWWTWTCMESTNRTTVIIVIIFICSITLKIISVSCWWNTCEMGLHLLVLWASSGFSPSIPRKLKINSSNVESCLNCIQLIILLLRIFPVLGCVIHLCPSPLTPAWWHMTASAWVSADWLISPLALPLRDNGNEWQHVQNVSQALHATLVATSGGFARSTTSLPLHAHVLQDTFWQLYP